MNNKKHSYFSGKSNSFRSSEAGTRVQDQIYFLYTTAPEPNCLGLNSGIVTCELYDLGSLSHLHVSQFPHLLNGDNNTRTCLIYCYVV